MSGLADSALASIGTVLFAGTIGGVFRTADSGASWEPASIGLPVVSDVQALDAMGGNVFAGSSSGIFLSTDNGASWPWSGNGLNYSYNNLITLPLVTALDISGTKMYAGGYSDSIFLSKDSGRSWVHVFLGGGGSGFVAGFVASRTNVFAWTNNQYYFEGGTAYQSTNGGANWTALNLNIAVTALAVMDTSLFAASVNGQILLSSNNGSTWKDVYIPLTDTTVTALAVNGSVLFAGTRANGVFMSPDNGQTWGAVNNGLPSGEWIMAFAVYAINLFAATYSDGVFLSTDNGASWTSVGLVNIGAYGIQALAVNDTYLYAGTGFEDYYGFDNYSGAGVWRRPLSDFGISSVTQTPAATQTEIQSYPNPFSQSTQISFTSASSGYADTSSGYADISIVNLLGEQVAHLFSGELDAGEHNFTFGNTSSLPDGMYECLIRFNGQVQTLPVVKLSKP